MTSATDVVAVTAGIVRPKAPAFDSPRKAVDSYLSWVSFAYEMANSDVATMTFSADEEVRVNSYVQLNKEKNRRIRQRLVRFTASAPTKVGKRTLLPAKEQWEYSYEALATTKSLTPTYTVSYVTTYTLVPRAQGGWIVDSVEAKALGEVK